MSLIRGRTSKRPCPICFVEDGELADITKRYPRRTGAHTKKLLAHARGLDRMTDHEKFLSNKGIRDVDVSHPKLCAHTS